MKWANETATDDELRPHEVPTSKAQGPFGWESIFNVFWTSKSPRVKVEKLGYTIPKTLELKFNISQVF